MKLPLHYDGHGINDASGQRLWTSARLPDGTYIQTHRVREGASVSLCLALALLPEVERYVKARRRADAGRRGKEDLRELKVAFELMAGSVFKLGARVRETLKLVARERERNVGPSDRTMLRNYTKTFKRDDALGLTPRRLNP